MSTLPIADSATPHRVLGPQPVGDAVAGAARFVVRAFHPDATGCSYLPARGAEREMAAVDEGVFAVELGPRKRPPRYRLRFYFGDGQCWERDDPYRFPPALRAEDLELLRAGRHPRLWQVLGAHLCRRGSTAGTRFAVWAPNARAVRLVGDFCAWDGRLFPMHGHPEAGVFELFMPGVGPGAAYQFEILTRERQPRLKTDPCAFAMDQPPKSVSRVVRSEFSWGDQSWMKSRRRRDSRRAPLSIYEVHLGSWVRDDADPDRLLGYRELAPRLIAHVQRFGFTHLELLPVAEHAFYGSWGYQVTGFYAPTSRYGTPDDLRYFVDQCHRHGIGVLMDWVPSHFPVDDHALRRFDGRPIYEVDDPVMHVHPDWGTLVFDLGRPQTRNFLVANALYWLREFHFDGLRVDAVSWMLRLDYGRGDGEWTPNALGGPEHLDGIAMLRELNAAVAEHAPGAITLAEEATSWPDVTAPAADGGLGFTFKWNMGWMNDTLRYFSLDPAERKHHQEWLTFAMTYESSEHFVNPLSHDEVVHLKRSLLEKMPGDAWHKLANLRLLLAYQFTRPGKKLLFMGTELAPSSEWNHDEGLDWSLWDDPARRRFATFLERLVQLYRDLPCLWRRDADGDGYAWIDGSDHERSVMSYVRRDRNDHVVVALNLTPTPRPEYRIGVPGAGRYVELLSSDDPRFGGRGSETPAETETEAVEFMGWKQSVLLDLPPLGAVILRPQSVSSVQQPPEGSIP